MVVAGENKSVKDERVRSVKDKIAPIIINIKKVT